MSSWNDEHQDVEIRGIIEEPDERPFAEEGPPEDPVVQLTANLQAMLDTLYTTIRLYHQTLENLTAVQVRCGELMEENRRLRRGETP